MLVPPTKPKPLERVITVYGLPAPQGSKHGFVNKYTGRVQMVESSKAVKPWREAVKHAAIQGTPSSPLGGPLCLEVVFTLPKPKSAPKSRQTWPDRKPDLSKLIRSTEDALTDAGVWEDDARVVECIARKCYPNEGADALNIPGAVIRIKAKSAAEIDLETDLFTEVG